VRNSLAKIISKERILLSRQKALNKVGERLLSFLKQHLQTLHQHPPKPLQIPERYLATSPPTNAPIISIVTPSFNQARFLEQTIRSVIAQDYPNLEYIIQDGASTDDSQLVLERYKSSLTYWTSAKDGGQANAINLGFVRTKGEIMAWLNADDLLLPGTLNYVANFFAMHPEVDIVYGHRILINEHNQEIGRWVLPPHNHHILLWADYVPQETLFWRRNIWDRAGGYVDESYHFALDWELLLRFQAAKAKFVRLPRFLAAFRVHPEQKTSTQISNLGRQEMYRLRERCHGRPVSRVEVGYHVGLYLARLISYHTLYSLGVLRY
jgi:glycosyltransferase involved in cell wall biosynthesis